MHYPTQTRSKLGIVKPKNILSLNTLNTDGDPTCLSKVIKHSRCQAAAEELNAFLENDTSELVPLLLL